MPDPNAQTVPTAPTAPPPAPPPFPPDVLTLMQRVEAGDDAAVPALRALLAAHPDLLTRLGDLAAHAEEGLLGLVAGPSRAARAVVRCHLDRLRADLGAATDSPLEGVLVGRVVLCWLAVGQAEVARAEALAAGVAEATRGAADRRVDRAHARLASAAKSLATVRGLTRSGRSPLAALLGVAGKPGVVNRLRDVLPAGVN